MEKIVLSNKNREFKTIIFNGQEFTIQPYITLAQEKAFINNYISSLFSSDNQIDNLIQAEYGLLLDICSALTNIEVIDNDGKIIQIDDLIYGGLWVKIQNAIENLDDFKWDLQRIITAKQNQLDLDKSVGVVLEGIAQKVYETLEKFSKLDLSEEGIKTLVSELQSNLGKLNADWGKTK
jgi:hypothetical protein